MIFDESFHNNQHIIHALISFVHVNELIINVKNCALFKRNRTKVVTVIKKTLNFI